MDVHRLLKYHSSPILSTIYIFSTKRQMYCGTGRNCLMFQEKIVLITGPTATGKTELGVRLALHTGGEIVSADSMQVYRGMDIGTAKPTTAEKRGVPHHMLDVAEPLEAYSAARYAAEAAACVDCILARGRLPILVGGTGLYIDALLQGRSFAGTPGDEALRRRLSAAYAEEGGAAFLEKLRALDPARAAALHPADKKRLVRAMEVCLLTGSSMTEWNERERGRPPRYASLRFALNWADRSRLYACIDERVDHMVSRGLAGEVQTLLDAGLTDESTAMQAIGYKETAAALMGRISMEEAAALIKRESRRYAKRQLTWLRRDKELHWILWEDRPDYDRALREVATVL
jgi:tRNA dimethylallyltransferase